MNIASPIQKISHPIFDKHQVNVFIKRDDLIDPIISGNKWRKLKYNIIHAQQKKMKGILSFGGAYSNHIHALAYACQLNQLKSHAIIRGEPEYQNNATLKPATQWGMTFTFVDRTTYKLRQDISYLASLQKQYPDYLLVPEGGSNTLALRGVGEVIDELNQQLNFDTLLTPIGSGGTLAGLIQADSNQHKLLGVAVLKQQDYLRQEVNNLLEKRVEQDKTYDNWQVLPQYHCGGYAKFNHQHCESILAFSQQVKVAFEPVYSGKMVIALLDLLQQGYFNPNENIVLLHTGGLQGLNGLTEQNKIVAKEWQLDYTK
jgi:1-aminocyclopropane-1-carboxylate deaminase